MILRITGLAVKAPTLFKTGAMASLTCLSPHCPNSCFQNCKTTVSLQYSKVSLRQFFIRQRYAQCRSIVGSGLSNNARIVVA